LDAIEWIYDAYGEDVNPIATDSGLVELRALCANHHVAVESVCADWFMDYPLAGVDFSAALPRWARLDWLIGRCGAMGIKRIVLPFVDASAIRNERDVEAIVSGISARVPRLDQEGVELHLEADLAPSAFADLLARLPQSSIKVNYDSGNSASLGYKPKDEFAAYGRRVGSVHIKDRVLGAGTVALGTGDTDFKCLFQELSALNYGGDFILQVARGIQGDELNWALQNVKAVRQMLRGLKPA